MSVRNRCGINTPPPTIPWQSMNQRVQVKLKGTDVNLLEC